MKQSASSRGKELERGAIMAELAIVFPLMLIVILATVDMGRLVYTNQMLTDLSREAGMLVSRGATFTQAFDATFTSDSPLDVRADGGVIISRVRRRDVDDSQPWVFTQERAGSLTSYGSKVGAVNGPATIPDVTSLDTGITIMVVEMIHPFDPIFGFAPLGLTFYPDTVYEAAYF